MRTKVVLIVAAIVMLIISTVAIGSNMGFKIVVQLNTGTYANNWVSLPYYNSYTNADSVKQDIGPACIQVSRWNQSSGTFDTWTGRGNNFTLIAGSMHPLIG